VDLDKRKWFVNWFFLSLAVLDKFRGGWGDSEYRYRKGTNLCHFVRVILLWTPLVVVLHLALYAAALAALIALPIYWFGLSGYLGTVVGLVVFAALVVLVSFVVAGVGKGMAYVARQSRANRQKREAQAASKPAPEKKGPSFGEVLWQFAVATKRRVCPVLNFKTAEAR
jgi:uncharacterized membrane protein